MGKGSLIDMGVGAGVVQAGSGGCRMVLAFNDGTGRGGMVVPGLGISERAFSVLEEVGAMCPTFRLYGISTGELRRPTTPELRRIAFGVGKREMGERTVRVAGLHSGHPYGSTLVTLSGGEAIAAPMRYDDQDERTWREAVEWYFERLRDLSTLAPNLEIPVPGRGMLGATEIGCSLVKLDLSPPMDFFRRGPLSSAQRDVWMAPHIAKQAKRAAEASAAAG